MVLYISKQLVKMPLQVPTQYSYVGNVIKKIQNRLGKHALKSDLKYTVIRATTKTAYVLSSNQQILAFTHFYQVSS